MYENAEICNMQEKVYTRMQKVKKKIIVNFPVGGYCGTTSTYSLTRKLLENLQAFP